MASLAKEDKLGTLNKQSCDWQPEVVDVVLEECEVSLWSSGKLPGKVSGSLASGFTSSLFNLQSSETSTNLEYIQYSMSN